MKAGLLIAAAGFIVLMGSVLSGCQIGCPHGTITRADLEWEREPLIVGFTDVMPRSDTLVIGQIYTDSVIVYDWKTGNVVEVRQARPEEKSITESLRRYYGNYGPDRAPPAPRSFSSFRSRQYIHYYAPPDSFEYDSLAKFWQEPNWIGEEKEVYISFRERGTGDVATIMFDYCDIHPFSYITPIGGHYVVLTLMHRDDPERADWIALLDLRKVRNLYAR